MKILMPIISSREKEQVRYFSIPIIFAILKISLLFEQIEKIFNSWILALSI